MRCRSEATLLASGVQGSVSTLPHATAAALCAAAAATGDRVAGVVLKHTAGLRYKHGSALASAEAALNQAALEMDAGKRLKLEALCSRARALYLSEGNTAF